MMSKHKNIIVALKVLEFVVLLVITYYTTKYSTDINLWILGAGYLTLVILWLIDFYFSDIHVIKITLLVKSFYEHFGFNESDDVRVTIHKGLGRTKYVQLIDYYPTGGKRGKTYNKDQGIVLYAFKSTNGEFSENFENDTEKVNRLVDKYNYTKEEAMGRLNDRKLSYYCCPILIDEAKIWGVLYMSAKRLNTFPKQEQLMHSELSKKVKALINMIEHEIN
jgi:hypothetical protein